jgi:predicted permease
MHDIGTDVRLALRGFRKAPGFTLASVLVLAIGLGAVTFMFSTLDSVALRPLPFEDPDELVWMWGSSDQYPMNSISYENYVDHREQVEAFESLAAFVMFQLPAVITGGGEPERVVSRRVTANLFPTLGIEPALGRGFVEEDGHVAGQAVAVLSHGVWLRRFGGDRSAVGSTVTLDGTPHEIVGVMPQGFDYPTGVDIWLPSRMDEGYAQGRGNNNFSVVGRLRDGADIEQARAQSDVVSRQLEAAFPDSNTGLGMVIVPLHDRYFSGVRAALVMLLGIVAVVLLIACANVASLALARATTRRTEVAVRLSLGAGRARVVRQLLTEHIAVAVAGGALGLVFAYGGIRLLKAFGPAALPRLETVGLDGRALAFAFVMAALTGLAFGTLPALRGTALSLSECLKAGGRTTGQGRSGGRAVLVVTQVALSLMLMIASGLLVRSFTRLQDVDVGFDVEELLLARIQVPASQFAERAEALQVWDQIRASLGEVPGVRSVGGTDLLPIRGGGFSNGVYAQGNEPDQPSDYLPAQRRFVTEGFLETLRLPLIRGRTFEITDEDGTSPVTIVTESLAASLWPGEDALGQFMVLPWGEGIPLEIVGVVGDTRDRGPRVPPSPTFYLSYRQGFGSLGGIRFVMRTEGDPMTVAASLREAVWAIESDAPVSGIQTMVDRRDLSVTQPKFRATLVAMFALTALILAVLGLYAVLSFFVRQHSHEIAVRVAVGADRGNVMRLVLRRGLTLAGTGVLLGLIGGLAGGRVLQGFLFGVDAWDPTTLIGGTAVMLLVALLASLIPARKAVQVPPVEALNTE